MLERLLLSNVICLVLLLMTQNVCYAGDTFHDRIINRAKSRIAFFIEAENKNSANFAEASNSHDFMLREAKERLDKNNFGGAWYRYSTAMIHQARSATAIQEGDCFILRVLQGIDLGEQQIIDSIFEERIVFSYITAIVLYDEHKDRTITQAQYEQLTHKAKCFVDILQKHEHEIITDSLAHDIRACVALHPTVYDFIKE